jgi:AraC-like DNA-binding protein
MPKLLLIPNFISFTYAPLFYLYLQRLLFNKRISIKDSLTHFIPFFLQILVFIPYFFLEPKKFQHKVVNEEFDLIVLYTVCGGLALIHNAYYLIQSKKSIKNYQKNYINQTAYHQNIGYLSLVLTIQAICIILGVFMAILFAIQYFGKQNIAEITVKSIDLIWLVFSLNGYFLGYYAIHQPEIFKLTNEDILNEDKIEVLEAEKIINDEPLLLNPKKSNNLDENLEYYKQQLTLYIEKDKPYINPNLTLQDLASSLKIPSHILSKVINDGFNKNFFDFVNSYRIEEFKVRVNQSKYQNYTLLGIAFDVGFNSKTAFNRSFKKITNQTPSEFYQSRKV